MAAAKKPISVGFFSGCIFIVFRAQHEKLFLFICDNSDDNDKTFSQNPIKYCLHNEGENIDRTLRESI